MSMKIRKQLLVGRRKAAPAVQKQAMMHEVISKMCTAENCGCAEFSSRCLLANARQLLQCSREH
jgi:hypothetical protein